VPYADLPEIDRWALGRTQQLIEGVTRAMDEYEFHKLYHLIHNFCAVDMSSMYLDILKDRVYTYGRRSKDRRSAQTVFQHVLLTLVKLCAPALSCTADEIWWGIQHKDEDVPSVHLAHWPKPNAAWVDEKLNAKWDRLMAVRSEVARELEKARAAKLIGSALESHITLGAEDEKLHDFLKASEAELPTLFIASQVTLVKGPVAGATKGAEIPELAVKVEKSTFPKCERCWNYRESVGQDKDHPTICVRCAAVVKGQA
jgi:isoleucyl-tRNA synthetase